jgi:hypothetical protein
MPYRSILVTIVTVMLALLAGTMWMRSVTPLLKAVNASTQLSTEPGNAHPAISFPTASSTQADRADRQFKGLVRATMFATILVICVLFVIGFFTTLRSWMRSTKPKRTRYVDAWKLAGERLKASADPESPQSDQPHK